MTSLTKSQSILHRDGTSPNFDCTIFVSDDKDAEEKDKTPHVDRKLVIAYQDWEDMGYPNTITLTIEPGDKLNEAT